LFSGARSQYFDGVELMWGAIEMAKKKHEWTLEEKAKLQGLLHCLDAFSKLDRDMPLQMIRTLVYVSIDEGQGPNAIGSALGVAPAVSSRHVADLGPTNRYHEDGYNLVEQHSDVLDRRTRRAYLAPAGVTLCKELLRALK
jgi:DNA-binding MarR family transcriptional regulator